MDRPIPAAYYVYGLRSRTGRARPYVGSTPHPPRRLAQHNGLITGGASKTARSGRPWDMMFVVAGFTSKIAALQFEWALGNYHLTNFIPTDSRLVHPVRVWRTKNGRRSSKLQMPQNQKAKHLFENLHLLLRVSGFSRWPLTVNFLRKDSFVEWQKVTEDIDPPLPPQRSVFLSPMCETDEPSEDKTFAEGVHKPPGKLKSDQIPLPVKSLNLTYDAMRPQVQKSTARLQSGLPLQCQICRNNIDASNHHILFCPLNNCDMVSHLTCLSSQFLSSEGQEDELVPTSGQCPKCYENIFWSDMVRQLSLHLRGAKEVAKILKNPKHKDKAATRLANADDPEANDDIEFLKVLEDEDGPDDNLLDEALDDNVEESDFEDIDAISDQSDEIHKLPPLKPDTPTRSGGAAIFQAKIIPDSDWDDIEQISD